MPLTFGDRAPASHPKSPDCECVTTIAGPILSSSAINAPLMISGSSETVGTRCCRNESTAFIGNCCTGKTSGYFGPSRQRDHAYCAPACPVLFATIGVPASVPNGPLKPG